MSDDEETIVLHQPLGASLVFGIFGAAQVALGTPFAVDGRLAFFGWLLALMGGALLYFAIAIRKPDYAYLRIDAWGLEYRAGRNQASYAWEDIEEVAVVRAKGPLIGIRLRPGHPKTEGGPTIHLDPWAPGSVPRYHDTMGAYSMDKGALVALLEARRRRALGLPPALEPEAPAERATPT